VILEIKVDHFQVIHTEAHIRGESVSNSAWVLWCLRPNVVLSVEAVVDWGLTRVQVEFPVHKRVQNIPQDQEEVLLFSFSMVDGAILRRLT
jgi:hypothetical protein